MDRGEVRHIPEMRSPLTEDGQGAIWSSGVTGAVRWTEGRMEPISPEACGIATLQAGVRDTAGGIWLRGRNPKGEPVLASFRAENWKLYATPDLGGRRVLSMASGAGGDLWAVLSDDSTRVYEVARISVSEVRIVPIDGVKPHTYQPELCVSRARLYLYGYDGLWESPLGERLEFIKVQADTGTVFTRAASIGETTAFVSQEGVDGNAVILLRHEGQWLRHRMAYGQALWLGQDGWLMAADGAEFLLWQTQEWPTPTYLSLPNDATITSLLRTADGDYWLGTSERVLHLRPGPALPRTFLVGPSSLIKGDSAVVRATAVAPFAPQTQPRRYSFSWRLDSGPWSGNDDWPVNGLPLGHLPVGRHHLEARARDGLGNLDPTPANLGFEVRPIPFQDWPWFRPALAGIGLLFAGLSLALWRASGRLRRYAGKLEDQVQARTAELREDIAKRERSEAERERLMMAIEQAAEIIIITDACGSIQYVNPTFEKITGYTRAEAMGRNPRMLKSGKHDLAFYRDLWATLMRGETWSGRIINRKKDGTFYTEEATISPVRDVSGATVNYVAAKRDVTQEIALQDQLTQAQKMEAVGQLAGGVAHDFNNMLQAILGNAALALEEPPHSPLIKESLEEIQKAAQRSADLTRQLLAFARKQAISPKVLDLNLIVAGMLKMLQRLIGEDIDLVWLPGAGLWPVKVDPSQVDQVLANLCVNARDAIQHTGKITIKTGNLSLDDAYAASHPDTMPGDYVMLAVSDTGKGMDAHTRDHLFEPFFTTKGLGQGTGLGLATVFGIVKQNRGLIEVRANWTAARPSLCTFPAVARAPRLPRKRVPTAPSTGRKPFCWWRTNPRS